MAKIVVPKTPAKAYNPNRQPSDLILKQIEHLEWALLPAAQRSPRRLRAGAVKTEAQAAEYIALLTERVHQAYTDRQAGPPHAAPLPPVTLPKVPKAPGTAKAPKTAGARTARPRRAARPRAAGARKTTSTRARR